MFPLSFRIQAERYANLTTLCEKFGCDQFNPTFSESQINSLVPVWWCGTLSCECLLVFNWLSYGSRLLVDLKQWPFVNIFWYSSSWQCTKEKLIFTFKRLYYSFLFLRDSFLIHIGMSWYDFGIHRFHLDIHNKR